MARIAKPGGYASHSRESRLQYFRERSRARYRAVRERDRAYRIVKWVRRMTLLTEAEREWRIRLITGPDDRSLTGRLLGDPCYIRSALYAKRMGWI